MTSEQPGQAEGAGKMNEPKKCPQCLVEMSWGRNTGWVCVVCPFPALTTPEPATNPLFPAYVGMNRLRNVVALLESFLSMDHGADCVARTEENEDDIGCNPTDYLENCDCSVKPVFESWDLLTDITDPLQCP